MANIPPTCTRRLRNRMRRWTEAEVSAIARRTWRRHLELLPLFEDADRDAAEWRCHESGASA